MANTVAGLAVSLGLNATDYFQGLTKAEYQAKKFSQSFSSGMGALKGALGGLGVGLIVNEIYDLGKSIVSAAADLNDFADQTGSSVEALSKLANQAEISGIPFEELQSAVLKLTVGMGGVDKKSQQIQATLKILGVTAKDPAEAMQQIAVALAKYEDGATKATYTTILFGKANAKFAATLKDMASLQDVAATTTKKQAEEAEKLGQAYRRLGVESTTFKNFVLTDVVGPLLTLITTFREARLAGLGFFQSLNAASALASGGDSLDKQVEEAEAAYEKRRKMLEQAKIVPLVGQESAIPLTRILINQTDVDDAKKKFDALKRMRSQLFDYSAFDKEKLKTLPEPPKAGGDKTARTPKDRVTEAQRYLETLEKQLYKTQELTTVETILAEIEAGRIEGLDAGTTRALLAMGAQVDAAKALKKTEEENEKLAKEDMKIREKNSELKQKQLKDLQEETEELAKHNEEMTFEIALIGKDATDIARLTKARIDATIATKEQVAAMYENQVGMEKEASAIRDQIRVLQARKGIIDQRGVAERMAEDVAKAKEINDLFIQSFAEGARSIIRDSKSIGDAIKSMGERITDVLLDMALTNIAKSLFGAPTSSGGGGIFGGIGAAIMGGIFGGGGGGISVPGIAGGTFNFAAGGQPPMGRISVVGERGPELFVPHTPGTIVPMNKAESMLRGNYVFNINVPAGATRSTIDQTRVKFGLELQNALDRGS